MAKTVISKDDLCKELVSRGYHPVLPFGDTSSGKTSLLLSLLAGLHNEKVPFRLDEEPLLSPDTEYGKNIYKATKDFFDGELLKFINNKVPIKTSIEYPIYVPVIVTNPRTKQDIKLAFLESNGEWYRGIGWDSDKGTAASHKKEIYEVLTKFKSGITCIYVAPYMNNDFVYKEDSILWNADNAIFAVLKDYAANREENRDNDNHLFVLNKWDDFYSPYKESERTKFIDPDWGNVEAWLELNYKHAWSIFFAMARITKNKSTLMTYSAGRFVEKSDNIVAHLVDVNETEISPTYKKMRRLIWNWIVRSANPKFDYLFNDDVR